MLKGLAVALLLVAMSAAATFWFVCPCEVVPGGPLTGDRAPAAVQDWSFVNDVDLCQLQVDRGMPWSINLNCMAGSSDLFVSCSQCAGKGWSQAVLDKPDGFIRVRETVYPVTIKQVVEPAELDRAWRARAQKLGLDTATTRPAHWWSFQLASNLSNL